MRHNQVEKSINYITLNIGGYPEVVTREFQNTICVDLNFNHGKSFSLRFSTQGIPYQSFTSKRYRKTTIPKFDQNHIICLDNEIYFNLTTLAISVSRLKLLADRAIDHIMLELGKG